MATKGSRTRLRSLEGLVSSLREERLAVYEQIDEAEGRLDELRAARRTLARRGVRGLRELAERRVVSKSLRRYLDRLL